MFSFFFLFCAQITTNVMAQKIDDIILPMEIVDRILHEAQEMETYEQWRSAWWNNVVSMIDFAFSMYHIERFPHRDPDPDPNHWAFWVPFDDEWQFQAMFCPRCGNYACTRVPIKDELLERRRMCQCLHD
jgi:hypothetical protein